MGVVFKDTQLQSEFEKNGYVIVYFLDKECAMSLLSGYEELTAQNRKRSDSPTRSHETEISIFNKNKEFTKAVHQVIVKTFAKGADELLNDYVPIMGNMVYKNPEETRDFSLHQDWRFSDETEHTTINIWCPLIDTNVQNGTLHIVKRSHLFQKETIRGANIGDASNKVSEFIKEHFGTSLSLKMGQAAILNTQLYHFSPPNLSKIARPVALLAMLPREAEMSFYYKRPRTGPEEMSIEKYKIDAEFMTSFNIDEAPEGVNLIEKINYSIDYFTEKSFSHLYQKYNQHLPVSLLYKEGKRIVFRDEKMQKRFEQDGYVKIDLLEETEVNYLRNKYEALSQKLKGKLQMISIYDTNKEFTSAVHKEVSRLFEEKLKDLLVDYKPIICYFVYKEPNQTEDLEIHQDASFSDESLHTTINIWCPLVDTNSQNGTLSIIKRSHLFAPSIRGFRIGYAVDLIKDFVKKYFSTSISMCAGQAIIMNTQLYHFSPPNRTEISRPTAVLAMLPKEAPLYMYYTHPQNSDKAGKIEHFEVEDNFLVEQFNVQEVPANQKSLGMVEYQVNYFSKQKLMELYKKHNQTLPVGVQFKYFFNKTLNRISK
jgi:ectoine hydroxylase-related dioxygenase (phytanoyl-CoA dioxygenase family)